MTINEVHRIGEVFALRLAQNDKKKGPNTFLIDSGATSHMFNTEKTFTKIKSSPIGKIKVANGHEINAFAKEDVKLELEGFELRCDKTLFVPEVKRNILSVARLVDEGYEIKFDEKKMQIYDKKLKIYYTGLRKDNLYYIYNGSLEESIAEDEINNCKEEDVETHDFIWENIIDDTEIIEEVYINEKVKRYQGSRSGPRDINELHRELGHMDHRRIIDMIEKGIVVGLELDKRSIAKDCHVCKTTKSIAGKKKTSFRKEK